MIKIGENTFDVYYTLFFLTPENVLIFDFQILFDVLKRENVRFWCIYLITWLKLAILFINLSAQQFISHKVCFVIFTNIVIKARVFKHLNSCWTKCKKLPFHHFLSLSVKFGNKKSAPAGSPTVYEGKLKHFALSGKRSIIIPLNLSLAQHSMRS